MSAQQHYLTFDILAQRVRREARCPSRQRRDGYWVFREATAGASFRHGCHEFITHRGDLVVADADTPFETRPANHHMHEPWLLAKPLLVPHLRLLARPLLIPLCARDGSGVLAASYLDMLTVEWRCLPASAMTVSVEILCRLIGLACGTEAADGRKVFFFEKKKQKTFYYSRSS